MKIKNDVANVLANSRVEGNELYLPEGQLDRKLYLDVNKVLTAIKGKWNRSAKAHIFPECPIDIIENILQTGEYTDEKKKYQIFETPTELADKLIQMAEIKEGDIILEPSAGRGRIANRIERLIDIELDCIELNPDNLRFLTDNGFRVIWNDFMDFEAPRDYDVIVANPPFTKQQDIDHVNKMMDIAKRRAISIMSASVLYRDNKKTVDFRNRVKALGGIFEELPYDTFAESGTKVQTCIVSVDLS